MSIWRIEPQHGWNTRFKEMTREQYTACRADLAGIFDIDEWKEDKAEPPYFYANKTLVTERDMITLSRYDLPFLVVAFKQGYFSGCAPSVEQAIAGAPQLHITVPNIGLLSIDEVTWEDDCCTNHLQSQLDDGWRILAVCPPNGDRRPTYILGRTRK